MITDPTELESLREGVGRILRVDPAQLEGDNATNFDAFVDNLAQNNDSLEEAFSEAANSDAAANTRNVITFFQVFLGRLPFESGLTSWTGVANGEDLFDSSDDGSLAALRQSFVVSDEFNDRFGEFLSFEGVVRQLFNDVLLREPELEGLAFWTERAENREAELRANGATDEEARAEAIQFLANAFFEASETESTFAPSIESLLVKIAQDGDDAGLDGGSLVTPGDGPSQPGDGDGLLLSDGRDNLTGTSSDDTFIGDVGQNQFGSLANALSTGDRLDGGEGTDRLVSTMINDADLKSNLDFSDFQDEDFTLNILDGIAPRPITQNIERVFIEALENGPLGDPQIVDSDAPGSTEDNVQSANGVVLDTARMDNVNQFWSNNSREDMTFMDVRLNDNQSVTGDITFGLRDANTDAGLAAAFETNSLVAAPDTEVNSQLLVRIADVSTETPNTPLANVRLDLTFDIGSETVSLEGIQSTDGTYAGLRDAIDTALANQGRGDLEVRVANPFQFVSFAGNTVQLPFVAQEVLVTDPAGNEFSNVTFEQEAINPVPDGFLVAGNAEPQDPTTQSNVLETNVVLDNAGRGSTAGDVVIGGMSNSDKAIEKLNLIVDRDSKVDDVTSAFDMAGNDGNSVTEAFSTIEVLSGENQGDLSINNVYDTRTFDASDFEGEKLSVAGTTGGGANVNQDFYTYTTPGSDDTVTFHYDTAAFDATGTGLEISTDGGEDVVEVNTLGGTTSEFANHASLENVTILTGGGSDAINVGDNRSFADIESGAGADYIQISDNVGVEGTDRTAAWIFNADDAGTTSGIVGRGNNDYNVFNISLKVEFQDIESEIVDVDFSEFVTTSDDINSAIIQAISEDAQLSQILEATEIKNGGLRVDSTIHRELDENALNVEFFAPTFAPGDVNNQSAGFTGDSADEFDARQSVTAAEARAAFDSWFPGTSGLENDSDSGTGIYDGDTSAGQVHASLFNAVDNTVNNMADGPANADEFGTLYNKEQVELGANSTEDTFNVVNAGSGDDMMVLSSKIGGGFDTVMFEGSFGTETIMNFNTGDGDPTTTTDVADQLNFSSYLDPDAAMRGSSATAVNDNRVDQRVDFSFTNGLAGDGLAGSVDHNANLLVGLSTVFGDLTSTAAANPTNFDGITSGMVERVLSENQSWVNEPSVGTGGSTEGEELVGSTFVFRVARDEQIETNADGDGIRGNAVDPLTEKVFSVEISGYDADADAYSFTATGQGSIEYGDMFSDLSDLSSENIADTQEAEDSEANAKDAIAGGGNSTPQAPTAVPDSGAVEEGQTTSIDIIADDTDPQGQAVTVSSINGQAVAAGDTVTLASGAEVTANGDGTVSYDSGTLTDDVAADETFADSFDYAVTDTDGNPSDPATVDVTVNGVDEGGGIQVNSTGTVTATAGVADTFSVNFDSSVDPFTNPDFDGVATIEGFDPAEDTLEFVEVGVGTATVDDFLNENGVDVLENPFDNVVTYIFGDDPDVPGIDGAQVEIEGIQEQNADFIEVA